MERRFSQGWPRLARAYRGGGAGRGSGHSVPANTEAFSRNQPTPSKPAERAMTHDLFPRTPDQRSGGMFPSRVFQLNAKAVRTLRPNATIA